MKRLDLQQARQKISRYCAYQERSHFEVRNKLYEFGLIKDEVEELLTGLITEGYLNEERFARAFAGGKFRMKKWGKIRISLALEGKGVSSNCIRLGLQEIDTNDYQKTLQMILVEKSAALDDTDPFVRKDKLSKYAIQKGFEPDLVWKFLKEDFPPDS